MFHLYCPKCDRAWPVPRDTDAIILLCPDCPTRRELRSGPVPEESPAILAIQSSPPLRIAPETLVLPEKREEKPGEKALSEYPINPEKIENFAGCGWMLIIGGGAACGLALWAAQSMERSASGWFLLVGMGGLILLLVGLGLASWARQNRNLCVRILPEGLERTWGSETIRCRWEDVNAVYENVMRWFVNGAYTKTTHEYRVILQDGQELLLDDQLQNVAKLGETVIRETFERMMPKAVSTVESGGVVRFGPVEVSREGLTRRYYEGGDFLPWSEVNNIDMNTAAGSISISRKTGKQLTWWQGSTAEVPNVMVFLQLLDGIVGVTRV